MQRGFGCLVCLLICHLAAVNSMARPRDPLPPYPEAKIRTWTFDEVYYHLGSRNAPAVVEGTDLVESWSGYALRREGFSVTPFAIPAVADDGLPNFTLNQGTIRFWFRPSPQATTSANQKTAEHPRLLELVYLDKNSAGVWWSLYLDPSGTALYLSGQSKEGPADFLTANIKWQPGEWHLLGLSYTPTNTVLIIDDVLAAVGEPLLVPAAERILDFGLLLGSDATGRNLAQGQFDELATFKLPWNARDLYYYYNAHAKVALLGPVTAEEDGAKWQAVLARKAALAASPAPAATATRMASLEGGMVPLFNYSPEDGFWLDTPVVQGTNLTLTLINAATNTAYDIYSTPTLNTGYSWTLCTNGAVGQFVFNLLVPTGGMAFYRAYSNVTILPTVDMPVFSPTNQYQLTPTNVTITCSTTGATIRYTLNGAVPTLSDPALGSGGSVLISTNVTLMAKAFHSGYTPSAVQSNTYTVHQAPTVTAGSQQIITGSSATLQGGITLDGFPGVSVTNTWSAVRGPGSVTFADPHQTNTTATFSTDGVYELQLVSDDGTFRITNRVVVARNPKVAVAIVDPTNNSPFTVPTNFVIRATASCTSGSVTQLAFYAGSSFLGIATSPNASGYYIYEWKSALAGTYALTAIVSSTDTNNTGLASTPINVIGNWPTNVGQFATEVTDLTIPVAGIPITVRRVYNSRWGSTNAFGCNWKLDYEDIQILTNSISTGWQGYSSGTYCIKETAFHLTTVSLSDSEKYYFTPKIIFQRTGTTCDNVAYPPDKCTYNEYVNLTNTPIPGGQGQLGLVSTPSTLGMYMVYGGWSDQLWLVRSCSPSKYEPSTTNYVFIAPDGTQYQFNTASKLAKKIDRNGNTLTFADDGITYSHSSVSGSTKRVKFVKTNGRITAVYDPMSLDGSGNITGPAAVTYAYDAVGNLTNVTRLVDRSMSNYVGTAYRYENGSYPHHITAITDPRGITTLRNEWDASGRLYRQYDAISNYTAFAFDPTGQRQFITNRLGLPTTQTFTGAGVLGSAQDASGASANYLYDTRGRKIAEITPLGQTNTYAYDSKDQLIGVTNELGQSSQATYNSFGQVLTAVDAMGYGTTNGYDTKGNLLAVTNALGVVSRYGYDVQGNLLAETNAFGTGIQTVTTYKFDASGYLTNTTDPMNSATAYTCDGNGNRLSETKTRTIPTGTQTLLTGYTYDAANRLIQTVEADGYTNRTILNEIGKQKFTIDKLNRTNGFYYDARGLLTNQTYPDGLYESFAYDAEGSKTNSIDRANHPTTYTYDVAGRLQRTIYADGAVQENVYDLAGRLSTVNQIPVNNSTNFPAAPSEVTKYYYDAAGRRVALTNFLGTIIITGTRSAYDANGNLLNVVDFLGRTNNYVYDRLNRQVQMVYPDSTSTSYVYDSLSRRIAITNQAGRITGYGYDALGRLIAVTNAVGTSLTSTNQFGYDEVGFQTNQVDALGRVTRFEYDALGRRTKRTLPGTETEVFVYDAAGNRHYQTNFNNSITIYTCDSLNRLTNKTYADGSSVSFAYSPTGQRTNMIDASGTTAYNYDSRDRLKSKATPQGTLSYSYDAYGNLWTIQSSTTNGTKMTYLYDGLNRLTNAADRFTNTTRYAFDGVGNLTNVVYPNAVNNSYAYNTLNRLTNMTSIGGTGGLATFAYMFDQAGNRTNCVETVNGVNRTTKWSYDALYRLTNETITASSGGAINYSYDLGGNRTNRSSSVSAISTSSLAYNSDDRITTDNYDASGNTTNSAGNVYGYDVENRLTNYNNGAAVYVYDGDGNRVRKTASGVTTYYLVDDRNPTGYAQVLEELSSVGSTPDRLYTYGFDLISQRQADATTSYYAHDGSGNVRFLTTSNSIISDTYTYDAFGILLATTGSTPNNYRYAGEQYDPTLGFYYLRARYMNPNYGRHWTRDTFDGDIREPKTLHKYTYAFSDPVNNSDPSGNDAVSNMIFGGRVHSLLGVDFAGKTAGRGIVDTRIDRILKLPNTVPIFGSVRPDLTDPLTFEVYEIKPVGSFVEGRVQLEFYIQMLKFLDPLKRPWMAGASYDPMHYLPLGYGSFAVVSPPVNGVILYDVVNIPLIVTMISAYAANQIALDLAEATLVDVVAGFAF